MEFKVGDKVVPHAKTYYGEQDLNESSVWKEALAKKQPYLFITRFETKEGTREIYLVCDSELTDTGDYFMPSDVTLYGENETAEIAPESEEPDLPELEEHDGVEQETGDIIVYSHCCSREDLAELVEYLEAKCWDYRIIKREKQ